MELAQPDRISVLTLNTWNRSGPWDERLGLVREGLTALAPDLVALQEILRFEEEPAPEGGATAVDTSQAQQIAEGLGYHAAYGPAASYGHGLSLGNAVLSRWPIRAQRTFELPVAEGQGGRSLLYALIESPCGPLPFFSTHLDWEFHLGQWRQKQVSFIASRVAELCPPRDDAFPPILCGDFNAEPAADEIRFLVGHTALEARTVYFADCFAVAGDGSPGFTFARRNTFAAPLREPNRRIDYVFVRGPDKHGRGEPLAARVVLDQPDARGVFASDHFGVLAEISTR